MLKPLTIGNITFPTNLIQAPLAGITCAPFRELIWRFGGVAYCVTEMISAKTLLHRPPKRYIEKSRVEGPLCFQLSGNIPEELGKAAAIAVTRYGAQLVDINSGCPVDKIRKKGCGSKLLADSKTLAALIKAIKKEVSVPLTVKIRVDGESGDDFNMDVIKAIEDAGADALIVHGRHWTEHYETMVRMDEIANIVAVSKLPIIANGDVQDYASLTKMFETTGCAGVMIGRASVGQPWLFAQLSAQDSGQDFIIPTPENIGAIFLEHITLLAQLENETLAVLQARKFSKYYARAAGLHANAHLSFGELNSLQELQAEVARVFDY